MHRLPHPSRRQLAAAALVALALGLALAFGVVPGVGAVFSAETENASSSFAGGWIPAPTGLSDAVGGTTYNQRNLSWTSGASASSPSPNPVTGQQILAADGGSGSTASCGSYSVLATLSQTATSYSDTAGNVADWWCYQVVSTSASTWTTSATFTPIRLLVPTSVVIANGGSGSNRVNNGDTITITFNQGIQSPAANHLCEINSGSNDVILLGDTRTNGTCATGDAYTIGKLTGGSVSSTTLLTESATLAGSVLTVKVTQNGTATATGTWTYTPATGLLSSSGSIHVCTAAACQVTTSGHF